MLLSYLKWAYFIIRMQSVRSKIQRLQGIESKDFPNLRSPYWCTRSQKSSLRIYRRMQDGSVSFQAHPRLSHLSQPVVSFYWCLWCSYLSLQSPVRKHAFQISATWPFICNKSSSASVAILPPTLRTLALTATKNRLRRFWLGPTVSVARLMDIF